MLGFSLFADCLLTLDYSGQRILLGDGRLPKPDGQDLLPFQLEPGGTPEVTLLIGDVQVPAILDSAFTDALAVPAGKKLSWVKGPLDGTLVASLTGRRRRQVGRLEGTVRLGRFTLDAPAAAESDPIGKIGAGALKFFTVTFDARSKVVRFAREGDAKVSSHPHTVGLGIARKQEGWQVVDVIPHSSAAAKDVEVGDLVISVNGRPVSEVDSNLWQSLLQSQTELSIELRRGESRLQIALPVTELVP